MLYKYCSILYLTSHHWTSSKHGKQSGGLTETIDTDNDFLLFCLECIAWDIKITTCFQSRLMYSWAAVDTSKEGDLLYQWCSQLFITGGHSWSMCRQSSDNWQRFDLKPHRSHCFYASQFQAHHGLSQRPVYPSFGRIIPFVDGSIF